MSLLLYMYNITATEKQNSYRPPAPLIENTIKDVDRSNRAVKKHASSSYLSAAVQSTSAPPLNTNYDPAAGKGSYTEL
jgi:hypothetical protein